MHIFVCGCLEDSMSGKKTVEIVDEVFNPTFDCKFFKLYYKDDIFVCCRDIISFCHSANKWYFFNKTCAIEELFSCYVSLNYGFKALCPICISPLVKKLFPFLIKIR